MTAAAISIFGAQDLTSQVAGALLRYLRSLSHQVMPFPICLDKSPFSKRCRTLSVNRRREGALRPCVLWNGYTASRALSRGRHDFNFPLQSQMHAQFSQSQSEGRQPLLICPYRRRFDLSGWFVSCIFSPASCQPADGANGHVVITDNLTTKPNTRQATCRQHIALSNCHPVRLAGDKFDPARRAACISTAGMHLIDSRVLFKSKHEALAIRDLEFTDPFNY